MGNTSDKILAAPCGIFCGECKVYKAKDNPQLQQALIARGMKKESVPCPGCRSVRGVCPAIDTICDTYTCAEKKGVEFCYQCTDFPCSRLSPAVDKADILPHNLKIYNLCFISAKGLNKWLEEAENIQNRYFQGKMVIGKGPEMPAD
ncbi:MAG TPA: DUF3795 domain-containing protein [Spirochaetia bacterium]|nr:DUF3795 domain-containing protein [Spirochaetia bacterium]